MSLEDFLKGQNVYLTDNDAIRDAKFSIIKKIYKTNSYQDRF